MDAGSGMRQNIGNNFFNSRTAFWGTKVSDGASQRHGYTLCVIIKSFMVLMSSETVKPCGSNMMGVWNESLFVAVLDLYRVIVSHRSKPAWDLH